MHTAVTRWHWNYAHLLNKWLHRHYQHSVVTWLLKSASIILHGYVVHTATLKLVIKSDMLCLHPAGLCNHDNVCCSEVCQFTVITWSNSMPLLTIIVFTLSRKIKVQNKHMITENSSCYMTSLQARRKYKIWDTVSL